MHDFLKMRREDVEPPLLTGFEPVSFSSGSGLGEAGYQGHRSRDRVVALATHLAKVRDLPILKPLRVGLCAVEQTRDSRRRKQSVVLGLERSELFSANVRASARHHHRCIPA